VKWEEVEQALKKKDASLLVFEAGQVLERVQKMGDLFEPVVRLKQKLPQFPEEQKEAVSQKGIDIAAQAETKRAPRKGTASSRSAATKKRRKV
jgi:bifunctional non-homologous end joining protein LigD